MRPDLYQAAMYSTITMMYSTITIVTDPLGREINLPEGLCIGGLPPVSSREVVHHAYRKVIETPSSIIEMPDRRVFYFRSVGWNFTVLIEVALYEGKWMAIGCEKNPSPASIEELLKEGTFIAGSSLN